MSIDYSEKIPNNVDLAERQDAAARARALAARVPGLVGGDGPRGHERRDVYLRTAISVEPEGWAHFDYVKMPDYRWGIFLAPAEAGRKVNFGEHKGEPAWQEVPGEYRQPAPAHRHAGRHRARVGRAAAPPRPHLPVALRPAQPVPGQRRGRPPPVGDGLPAARATSAATAARRPRRCSSAAPATPTTRASSARSTSRRRTGCRSSCSRSSPTATASTSCAALAESGFDPLARTCRFMLTEEAHHMFVGETGRRAHHPAHLRGDERAQDRRPGDSCARWACIDLPTIQSYLNFHYSVTIDLFGAEVSSNAATFYTTGLKGRFEETKIADDHVLDRRDVPGARGPGRPARDRRGARAQRAQREAARRLHQATAQAGVERWNKIIEKARRRASPEGAAQGVQPPDRPAVGGAHRSRGQRRVAEAEWTHRRPQWLPTDGGPRVRRAR